MAAASNREKDLSTLKNTVADLGKLGEAFGKRLVERQIASVVFDRNGFAYHGRVKALAEGIRKSGIRF